MSAAARGRKLRGREQADILPIFDAVGRDKLDAADVYRTGVADDAAGDQRPIPHLLGIQSYAFGYDKVFAYSGHARHVSAGGRGRLYVPRGAGIVWHGILVARAAQDVPLYCGDDVLKMKF